MPKPETWMDKARNAETMPTREKRMYEKIWKWGSSGLIILLSFTILGASSCEECETTLPGEQAFQVENGLIEYIIDPLNEVCLVEHTSGAWGDLQPLPHKDCLRLIQRYVLPLPEPKAEAEEDGGR